MGLRSPSAWQPQDTRTQMSQGNIPGLTPKQEDMSFARSPLAFQQQNVPKPKEETGTTPGERVQTEKEAREAQGAQVSTQARQQQQASPISMAVENVASKLSNFSYSLRGYVNQFLQGGASGVGLGGAQEQYKFDPLTGKSVLTISEQQADIEPVLQEKMRQQERLKQTLSPFAKEIGGKLVGKQFGQVLEEQFGEDPQISSLLQMVTSLQDLEARGLAGSPEARALEAQLRQQDQFGMVSSLREAMQTYNKLMGVSPTGEETKWYGDAADTGYSALDLAQLSTETLRTEIEKAREFSSGLFGGDFEENLRKKFDTESAEAQAAAKRKAAVHEELFNAFDSFIDETGGQFETARNTIDTAFQAAAAAVKAELMLDNSPEGIAAMTWFESLQGGDFRTILYNALNDPNSGLGVEQRQKIADFIGKVGSSSKEGQLYTWMESLGSTGKIPITTRVDGVEKTQFVEPTVEDKLQISALMKDKTLSPEEKQEKLHELIRGIGVDSATNIGTTIDNAVEVANRTGSLAAGLVAFNRGIAESLKTFAQSKTEDFVRQALQISDDQWNALDQASRSALITRTLKNMTPEQKEQLVSIFHEKQNKEQENKKVYIQQWEDSLNARLQAIVDPQRGVEPAVLKQKEDLQKNRDGAYKTFSDQIQKVATTRSGKRYSEIYSSLAGNQWIQNNVEPGMVTVAASVLEAQERFSRIASISPELARLVTGGAYQDVDVTELLVQSAQSKDYTQLTNLFDAYNKASVFNPKDTQKFEDVSGFLDSMYNLYQTNPNQVPPTMLTFVSTLAGYDNTLSDLDENLQQIAKAKDDIYYWLGTDGKGGQLEKVKNSLEMPSFTPDQILGFSMDVARGVETGVDWITGDKKPPSLGEIDWSKIGGTAEDLITGWAGYGPEALRDELAKRLGFPAEAISIQGGVPHIQLSNGEYIPFTSELVEKITPLTAAFQMPSVAAIPEAYAGPEISAAPDLLAPGAAKIPIYTPPPPPKITPPKVPAPGEVGTKPPGYMERGSVEKTLGQSQPPELRTGPDTSAPYTVWSDSPIDEDYVPPEDATQPDDMEIDGTGTPAGGRPQSAPTTLDRDTSSPSGPETKGSLQEDLSGIIVDVAKGLSKVKNRFGIGNEPTGKLKIPDYLVQPLMTRHKKPIEKFYSTNKRWPTKSEYNSFKKTGRW